MLRRFLCTFYCKTLTHPQLFEAISLSSPPYAAWWNCLSTGSWRWRFFVAPTLSEQGDIAFCLTLSFRTTLCKLLNLLVTCGLYKVLGSYFGCVFLASCTFKQHQVWLSSNRTPHARAVCFTRKGSCFTSNIIICCQVIGRLLRLVCLSTCLFVFFSSFWTLPTTFDMLSSSFVQM